MAGTGPEAEGDGPAGRVCVHSPHHNAVHRVAATSTRLYPPPPRSRPAPVHCAVSSRHSGRAAAAPCTSLSATSARSSCSCTDATRPAAVQNTPAKPSHGAAACCGSCQLGRQCCPAPGAHVLSRNASRPGRSGCCWGSGAVEPARQHPARRHASSQQDCGPCDAAAKPFLYSPKSLREVLCGAHRSWGVGHQARRRASICDSPGAVTPSHTSARRASTARLIVNAGMNSPSCTLAACFWRARPAAVEALVWASCGQC